VLPKPPSYMYYFGCCDAMWLSGKRYEGREGLRREWEGDLIISSDKKTHFGRIIRSRRGRRGEVWLAACAAEARGEKAGRKEAFGLFSPNDRHFPFPTRQPAKDLFPLPRIDANWGHFLAAKGPLLGSCHLLGGPLERARFMVIRYTSTPQWP